MSDFGDRMKLYESLADRKLMPLAPICARIDGRAFHTWTQGLEEPFDDVLRETMIQTAVSLVKETNARIAHTHSDEISLVFVQEDFKKPVFFDGRHQKLCSVLASLTTGFFLEHWISMPMEIPAFDCRVWNVPNLTEAANCLVWRERDAVRNSIQMAARAVYSHEELHGKNSDELQEMLFQKGINWNDYPAMHKRGQYIKRVTHYRVFTPEEIEELPEKHAAKTEPGFKYERREVLPIEMPPITKLEHDERIKQYFTPYVEGKNYGEEKGEEKSTSRP